MTEHSTGSVQSQKKFGDDKKSAKKKKNVLDHNVQVWEIMSSMKSIHRRGGRFALNDTPLVLMLAYMLHACGHACIDT